MKLVLKWVLGVGIGVLFVWLAARSWPFEQIFQFSLRIEGSYLIAGDIDPELDQYLLERTALGAAGSASEHLVNERPQPRGWYFDLFHILPYFLFLTAIHFLRVVRWYPLLKPIAHVGFWDLNRIGAVGFMAVFIFPLRLGELVRPYMLSNEGKVRGSAALATIVVERVFDGLMTSLLLFATLVFLPSWNQESYAAISLGAFIALSVFVGCLGLLVLAYWRREWTIRAVRRLVGRGSRKMAERIVSIIEAFLQGLAVLPHWRSLALFSLLTALYWGINGLGLYIFCRGFGLHIPLLGAYAMMTCVVVGMMIPNSPANVGSFWYFLLMPLALYGLHSDNLQATVCALAIWTMQLLQQVLFAAYFFVTGKVSWRSVWRLTTRHGSADEAGPLPVGAVAAPAAPAAAPQAAATGERAT